MKDTRIKNFKADLSQVSELHVKWTNILRSHLINTAEPKTQCHFSWAMILQGTQEGQLTLLKDPANMQ